MFATDSPTVAPGRELALGLLAGGIVYFAPTLVALARHRGAAPLTVYVNLLLGWTIVGWLIAWLLAFADRRLHVSVANPAAICAPQLPLPVTVASDGRHWWDGYMWRDGWQVVPAGPPWSPHDARRATTVQGVPPAEQT